MGMVRNTTVLKMAECSHVCSLGDGNPIELDLEHWSRRWLQAKDWLSMLYDW